MIWPQQRGLLSFLAPPYLLASGKETAFVAASKTMKADLMILDGVWSTPDGRLIYRILPKCGCSSIGQMLYFAAQGRFYPWDIHDADGGLLKWRIEPDRPKLIAHIRRPNAVIFTAMRNPYRRVLSAFFDKIGGRQRDGTIYCHELYRETLRKYGINHGAILADPAAQIFAFQGFMRFAAATLTPQPVARPDIHWEPMSAHLSRQIRQGMRLTHAFHVETMQTPLQTLLKTHSRFDLDVASVPKFNPSGVYGPKQMAPTAEYFDDFTVDLMRQTYAQDFDLMRYDPNDPSRRAPIGDMDLDQINTQLACG